MLQAAESRPRVSRDTPDFPLLGQLTQCVPGLVSAKHQAAEKRAKVNRPFNDATPFSLIFPLTCFARRHIIYVSQ